MSNIDKDKTLPQIHQREIVAESRFFRVERVDLEFTNGATRQFERMAGYSRGAVMIVAVQDGDFLLVREYAAGTHTYELGFPKGLIDQGESILEAAIRSCLTALRHLANTASATVGAGTPISNALTDGEKSEITGTILKGKNVVSITPQIVDPNFTNLELDVDFKYNPNLTDRSSVELQSVVRDTISDYNFNNLNKFDGVFRHSQL